MLGQLMKLEVYLYSENDERHNQVEDMPTILVRPK